MRSRLLASVLLAATILVASAAAQAQRRRSLTIAVPDGPEAVATAGQAIAEALVAQAQASGAYSNVRAGAVSSTDASMLVGCGAVNTACYRRLRRVLQTDLYMTTELTPGSDGLRAESRIVMLRRGRVVGEHAADVATDAGAPAIANVARTLLGLEPEAAASPEMAFEIPSEPTTSPAAAEPATESRPAPPESVAERPRSAREREVGATPASVEASVDERPRSTGARGIGVTTIVSGVGAALLLGGGAAFALMRDQAQTEFNQSDNTTLDGIHRMQGLRSDWERSQMLSFIGYGAGAAALALGTLLLVLDLSSGGGSRLALGGAITSEGGAMSIEARF